MLATIDPIALKLGPISIHWYAICIVSGLLLAVYLAQRWAPEKGIDPENILAVSYTHLTLPTTPYV